MKRAMKRVMNVRVTSSLKNPSVIEVLRPDEDGDIYIDATNAGAYFSPASVLRLIKALRAEAEIVRIVRGIVVERAHRCCESCGVWVGESGHAHHVIPRSRGGAWTVKNITYLCAVCHGDAHEKGCR